MTKCSVDGCSGTRKARGFCQSHYYRYMRYGSALAGRAQNGKPLKFLLSLKDRELDNECIIWPFAKVYAGYGTVVVDGKQYLAHRVSCRLSHGEPEEGMHAAHSCNNPSCVNPRHLRWATPSSNNNDKLANGTLGVGERNPFAKLTWAAVDAIRADKRPRKVLALEFGVSIHTIDDVLSGRRWNSTSRARGCFYDRLTGDIVEPQE